jgi:hypothetical protein
MKSTTSREILLASRPRGIPTAANYTGAQTEPKPLHDYQALVCNLFITVYGRP